MKILVINGPNLNMLGIREPEKYGKRTYAELEAYIMQVCAEAGAECEVIQSNSESEIITEIQREYGVSDGIIINAAGYTHTSVAILDALLAVGLPAVEVHLTDINVREAFRRVSYLRQACFATVSGRGFEGYKEAVRLLTEKLSEN